jgi:hypothetical protein
LTWIPVALWELSQGVTNETTFAHLMTFIFYGIIFWSFLEYGLHRFVFHFDSQHPITNTIHFLIHGVHHLDPLGKYSNL